MRRKLTAVLAAAIALSNPAVSLMDSESAGTVQGGESVSVSGLETENKLGIENNPENEEEYEENEGGNADSESGSENSIDGNMVMMTISGSFPGLIKENETDKYWELKKGTIPSEDDLKEVLEKILFPGKTVESITMPEIDFSAASDELKELEVKDIKIQGKDETNTGKIKVKVIETEPADSIFDAEEDGSKSSETPDNYVKVSFEAEKNGKITGKKVFYVEPGVKNKFEGMTAVPNEGYEFAGWKIGEEDWDKNKEHAFKEAGTIKAVFKKVSKAEAKEITAYVNEEVTEEDYKKSITPAEGKEIKSIKVKKPVKVDTPGEKTAEIEITYKDSSTEDIKVKVKVIELPDIIAASKGKKPSGYLEIKIDVNGGKLAKGEEDKFYVKSGKNVKIPVSEPEPPQGKDFLKWSSKIKSISFDKDTTIKAEYISKPRVSRITVKKDSKQELEDLLKAVTFPSEIDKKDIETKLKKKPDTSKVGTAEAEIEYSYKNTDVKGKTITVKLDVTEDGKAPDDTFKGEKDGSKPSGVPDNYKKITFSAGQNGTMPEGAETVFYVNPDKKVTIDVKDPVPKAGYKFTGWSSDVKNAQFDKDTLITAKYEKLKKNVDDDNPGSPTGKKDENNSNSPGTNKSIPRTLAEIAENHGFKILGLVSAAALVFLVNKRRKL